MSSSSNNDTDENEPEFIRVLKSIGDYVGIIFSIAAIVIAFYVVDIQNPFSNKITFYTIACHDPINLDDCIENNSGQEKIVATVIQDSQLVILDFELYSLRANSTLSKFDDCIIADTKKWECKSYSDEVSSNNGQFKFLDVYRGNTRMSVKKWRWYAIRYNLLL